MAASLVLMCNRHLVTGILLDPPAVNECRSMISHAYSAISSPNAPSSFNEQLQPASVTKSLLIHKGPSIPDLIEFAGYDERSV